MGIAPVMAYVLYWVHIFRVREVESCMLDALCACLASPDF